MKKAFIYVLGPALAGLVFALALLLLPGLLRQIPDLAQLFQAPSAPVSAASYSGAVKGAAPAVVSINSKQQVLIQRPDRDDPFRGGWESILGESSSLGSGVIISPDGYIITSYHIFFPGGGAATTGPNDITVTLSDGRTMEARRLIMDEENDLALLKVDAEGLPFLRAGHSHLLEVGDVVLAIGNPRNIGQSVSLGIVSALLRRDDSYVIQTDAAINPGNSGGALIDVYGRLVGINSTLISASGGSEGIGFATPAENAIALMAKYIESGPGGYLGVEVSEAVFIRDAEGRITEEGLRVERVTRHGPAERAGIRAGDIITAFDEVEVKLREDGGVSFIEELSTRPPGERIEVAVIRDGEELQIPVTLAVGEPSISRYFREEPPPVRRLPTEVN